MSDRPLAPATPGPTPLSEGPAQLTPAPPQHDGSASRDGNGAPALDRAAPMAHGAGGTPASTNGTGDHAVTATPTEHAGGSDAASGTASDGAGHAPPESQRVAESESLAEHGVQLCRTARWRQAIEPLRRATELDPANATAFYYLGDAYNHADALAQALEAFETAARIQPDHWRALKGVGIVLDRMHRPHEATAAYQRARDAQSRTTPRLS